MSPRLIGPGLLPALLLACTGKVVSDAPTDDSSGDSVPAETEPGFVRLEAGTFEIGCTEAQPDCRGDETAHDVTLTHAFLIGISEITQGEFQAVTGYNPSSNTACDPDQPEECPVENLTWHEAAAYTVALSTAAGLEACYSCGGSQEATECEIPVSPYECAGYRLPTEAEWEVAARCGTDFVYPGSDDSEEVAWTAENSDGIHKRSELASNACGTVDMGGNVFEWTQDWWGELSDYGTDPDGASGGGLRAVRGGGVLVGREWARVSARSPTAPDKDSADRGVRVVRTTQP